ncbi:hypothetical protein GCM10007860_33410 [Chitiniphilus shinanonensis]|uniref:ABC-type transport auxiliary lipoprotein component domain-containing protein n=1 Tax=Chitiniphilus shinanonensis TaxID=553088 RepID=A0ABQ6C0Z9_9NEIS|nr:hypothetical protein [Chitiniphilus shinanonensis]GLS06172.1 hypothetical protein GCM10007860_33410 [Chitiniphilus shinanonensis]
MTRRLPALFATLCLALFLAGCASKPEPQTHYRFDAARAGAPAAQRLPAVLRIAPLQAAEGYRDWRFVYRESDYRYAADPYRGFVAPPAALIGERSEAWLAASGLFQRAYLGNSPNVGEWVLRGRLEALYADLRPGAPRQVVLALHYTLLRDGQPAISWTSTGSAAIGTVDGDGIAAAADAALVAALKHLESMLATTDVAVVR